MSRPKGQHGGRRAGAGRKPKGEKAGHPHTTRPALASRRPVHVTIRMLPHVWNLRGRGPQRIIGRALELAEGRFGARFCECSIQGNDIHLVVEATDEAALSRAMQGMNIRIARGLNGMMRRHGPVFADRYLANILRTPGEVRRALATLRQEDAQQVGVGKYASPSRRPRPKK